MYNVRGMRKNTPEMRKGAQRGQYIYRLPADVVARLEKDRSLKWCARCKQLKNREKEFHRTKTTYDGHVFYCKQCVSKFHRKNWQKKMADPKQRGA